MAIINQAISQQFFLWDDILVQSEIVLDAYGSLERANIYFDNRLRAEPWKRSSIGDRKAAMLEATELIDRLNFVSSKSLETQLHQFPRNADLTVPSEIEKACYEIALKLLDGYDPDMEVDNLAAESQGFSTVRETYNRTFALDHMRAGIPSAKAWEYLKPYLAEYRSIKICRVD